MTKDEIIQAVRDGKLSPQEGLTMSQTHSTKLGDIIPKFTSEALKCGFPSMEAHQYIMKDESNLIVMAARPGNGKTALACQIALNVSTHSRVLMFSLEMRKESLAKRLLSVVSQIPIKQLAHPSHSKRIKEGMADLATRNFSLIDDLDLSVNKIIAKSKDENQNERISLIVIDYLSYISIPGQNTPREYADAVKKLKTELADNLKIPVLLLAQMNRNFEDRYAQFLMTKEKAKLFAKEGTTIELAPPQPVMADLAETSGAEKNTDVAMFLHRPYLLDKSVSPSLFNVYVTKNRNGVVKDFTLTFSDSMTTFFDEGDIDL